MFKMLKMVFKFYEMDPWFIRVFLAFVLYKKLVCYQQSDPACLTCANTLCFEFGLTNFYCTSTLRVFESLMVYYFKATMYSCNIYINF